jgi:hypothetical protein
MAEHSEQGDSPAPAGGAGKPARRRWRKHVLRTIIIGVPVALAVGYVGIKARWWRPPYPPAGKDLCWIIRCPEEAYNFGVVEPGRLYRASRPDERLYRYAASRYGVRRVIRLVGKQPKYPIPYPPEDLGLEVVTLDWDANVVPPREELEEVLSALDSDAPALVHCSAGVHRAGYAVGAWRILRRGWPAERARAEMRRYAWRPLEGNALYEHLNALGAEAEAAAERRP